MNALEALLREHIRGCRETIAEATRRVDALEELTVKVGEVPEADQFRANGWTKEEEEILFRHYPEGGSITCSALLPHRTPGAIRTHARRLGVVTSPNAQRFWCDQCQFKVNRGQVAACASKFCHGKRLVARGDA